MLSSLTFTGIPSKAFAQDWVYAVGNMMIPVVAVLAVGGLCMLIADVCRDENQDGDWDE